MFESDQIKNIAVLIPNWLGDVVMCTPALRALRRQFPQAQITALGRSAPCALLQGFAEVDRLLTLPTKLGLTDMINLRREYCARPDLAVVFPHSLRAAVVSRVLGAKRVLGYARGGRRLLLSDAVEPYRENGKIAPIYMVREYLDLLASIGVQEDGKGPNLATDAVVVTAIRQELPQVRPLVGIAPGAAFGPSKRWLAERYAEVADRLREECGASCVLICGPGEEETRDAVQAAARKPLHLCDGATPSVERLKAIISELDLFIGNDSGPRHIAVAFEKPVICIMGSTRPAYSMGPFERGEVLRVDVDCGPCQKPVCLTDFRCMTGVSVEQVVRAARRFL